MNEPKPTEIEAELTDAQLLKYCAVINRNTSGVQIGTVVYVSYTHVKPEDLQLLETVIHAREEYYESFIVMCNADRNASMWLLNCSKDYLLDYVYEAARIGLSQTFCRLLEWASNFGPLLILDQDGPIYEWTGLEIIDWDK